MAAELIDLMLSLYHVMEEETQLLAKPGRRVALPELAAAKVRLVGQLDAEIVRLKRETPDWMDLVEESTRDQLTDAAGKVRDASAANAEILERQIEFSIELMGAIASEAQRVTGKRNTTYSKSGGVATIELPAPISVNARL